MSKTCSNITINIIYYIIYCTQPRKEVLQVIVVSLTKLAIGSVRSKLLIKLIMNFIPYCCTLQQSYPKPDGIACLVSLTSSLSRGAMELGT